MMTEEQYQAEFERLRKAYSESEHVEDLAALTALVDNHVYALKTDYKYRDLALKKIRELEDITELPHILLYRKAVLYNAVRMNHREAFQLFMNLIGDEAAESFIRDRSIGYLLLYSSNILGRKEELILLKRLRVTQDAIARQLLEQYEFTTAHNWFEYEEDELPPEEIVVYRHSGSAEWKSIVFARQLTLLYEEHPPDRYDLYLDLVNEQWFSKGVAVGLTIYDVRVLIQMISLGAFCTVDDLYKTRYRQVTGPQSKQERNMFDKYYGRLKKKLLSLGVSTNHYALASGTSYFVVYPENKVDDIFV